MKAVIKKRVLFNFLKKALNESRSDYTFYSDGSFLGRFEEEEEKSGHIDSDMPLRANPAASFQLHSDNFDVTDPEFVPSSKSGLISASAAILDHIPDRQIEFAYEELHRLLDRVMSREDDINFGKVNEALNRVLLNESRSYYINQAAERVRMGEDGSDIAQDLIELYPEFENDDYFELGQEIEDAAYASAGFDMNQDDSGEYSDDDHEAAVADFLAQAEQKPQSSSTPSQRKPKRIVVSSDGSSEIRDMNSEKQPPAAPINLSDVDIDDVNRTDITNLDNDQAVNAIAKETLIGLGLLAMAIESLEARRYALSRSDQFSPQEKARKISELPHVRHNINNYKTFFLYNFDSSSRKFSKMFSNKEELAAQAAHQIRVAFDHGVSFLEPPTQEFDEIEELEVNEFIPDDGASIVDDLSYDGKRAYDSAVDKEQFMAGYNAGADFDPDYGTTPTAAGKTDDYIKGFELGHKDIQGQDIRLSEAKIRIEKLDSVVAGDIYREKIQQFRIFKANIVNLQKKLGLSLDETIQVLADEVADIMVDQVQNLDYNPDKNLKREEVFRNNFASTTVYATGTAAGPGGTKRDTAKPYQGNKSATFYRRVKEEYREDIIADFLDLLTNKYMSGNVYKINSGRKDPENPKRNEKYEYDPIEFREAAEAYANKLIDDALADQERAARGEVITPEDEVEQEILPNEESPEPMSDEEIAEKLSNTKDFDTLAPFFGFSAAPGMRQWFLKFAKRFFEMGLISAHSGDRTLLKFHSHMVEAVLETLSEKLPDLMLSLANETDRSEENKEKMAVLQRMTPQIEDAFQEFLDSGDLHSVQVSGKSDSGTDAPMRFLDTLGGQLTRAVNGMFFKKVLTKLDKTWTDYVAEQLQTNQQFQNYIADNIADAANIDAKAAKSIAEYFIGKKNAPEILQAKTPGGPKVYRSEAEGNPTKGVRALLKYGIDANAYDMIRAESIDWFEDMLMTDFARELVDGEIFEGEYRQMITKEYDKLKSNDKNFRKVIMQALGDVIVGSSQRMAMANLSDYEVD